MRLVDHDESGALDDRTDPMREGGVGETLGRDQEYVDRPRLDVAHHCVPVVDVRRVDRRRGEARGFCGLDLITHQCEQRRHHERRTVTDAADGRGGRPVHRRFTPTGRLDHQDPSPVGNQRSDRRFLIVASHGVRARHGPQHPIEVLVRESVVAMLRHMCPAWSSGVVVSRGHHGMALRQPPAPPRAVACTPDPPPTTTPPKPPAVGTCFAHANPTNHVSHLGGLGGWGSGRTIPGRYIRAREQSLRVSRRRRSGGEPALQIGVADGSFEESQGAGLEQLASGSLHEAERGPGDAAAQADPRHAQ